MLIDCLRVNVNISSAKTLDESDIRGSDEHNEAVVIGRIFPFRNGMKKTNDNFSQSD